MENEFGLLSSAGQERPLHRNKVNSKLRGNIAIPSCSEIFRTRNSYSPRQSFKSSIVSSFKTTVLLMEYWLKDNNNITINFSVLLVLNFFFCSFYTIRDHFFWEKIFFVHCWIFFYDSHFVLVLLLHRNYERLFHHSVS